MREIKFRAWDRGNKEMVYPDEVLDNSRILGRWDIVMQYTGLKDMNGVEIYEGDIVTFRYPPSFRRIGTVVFRDGCFDVEFTHSIHLKDGTFRKWDYLKVFVANDGVYILGNVYENPELLESSHER